MAYQSKYTGLQIDDILDSVEWKQGKIEDLASIRAGAQKGATALQSYTEKYTGTVTGIKINGVVKSGSGVIDLGTITTDISGKVDKVAGKQLSTEDFTTALKNKLEGLSNYDDTELSDAIETLRGDFDNIVSGDTTTAIKTFNEVIAFLDGLTDTQDLESIIASIEQQIAGKMDTLISGTNIKTINGESILGSGNITISGGGSGSEEDIRYFTEFTVEDFIEACETNRTITYDTTELFNAMKSNKVICVPYRGFDKGFIVASYQCSNEEVSYPYMYLQKGDIEYYAWTGDNHELVGELPTSNSVQVVEIVGGEVALEVLDNCIYRITEPVDLMLLMPYTVEKGTTIHFVSGESGTALEMNCVGLWANGEIPQIEPNTFYELSIMQNAFYEYNIVLTPFKN